MLASNVALAGEWLQGCGEEAADVLDIGAVGYANGHTDEGVAVVARHVLEVTVEEGFVEERDDVAVERYDLRRLVGDALDFAYDAVALDEVAYTQAPRHERETVEEVLDEVLHGKTQTGGQTCRDDGDAALGHVEDH